MSIYVENQPFDLKLLTRLAKYYVPAGDLHIRDRTITGPFRKATEQDSDVTENNVFMLVKMVPHYLEKHSAILIRADERGGICEFYFLQPR